MGKTGVRRLAYRDRAREPEYLQGLVQLPGMPFDAPNRLGETPLTPGFHQRGDALAVDWLIPRMGQAGPSRLDTIALCGVHRPVDILERLLAGGAPSTGFRERDHAPDDGGTLWQRSRAASPARSRRFGVRLSISAA